MQSQSQSLTAQAGSSWQCKAASAVVVLTELLHGASNACQPEVPKTGLSRQTEQQPPLPHALEPGKAQTDQSLSQQQPIQVQQSTSQAQQPRAPDSGKHQDQSQSQQQPSQVQLNNSQVQQQLSQIKQNSSQIQQQPSHVQQSSSQAQQQSSTAPQSMGQHQQMPHAMHAELEQLILNALEEFSSAGVWRLPTHQDTDVAASQHTLSTPQVSLHHQSIRC